MGERVVRGETSIAAIKRSLGVQVEPQHQRHYITHKRVLRPDFEILGCNSTFEPPRGVRII